MAEETIETRTDWNNGDFDKTSADRNDESGDLGIGYINGDTSVGDTTQPRTNLLQYYRFDEDFGSTSTSDTVSDYSGNNNEGTTENGVDTTRSGIFDTNSYGFNGTDSFIDLGAGDTAPLAGATEASFSLWVYPESTADDQRFWTIADSDPDNFIRIGGDLSFACLITDNEGDGLGIASTDNILNENEWQHIVFVWEGGNDAKLYLNGEDITDSDFTNENATDNPSQIKDNSDGNEAIGTQYDGSSTGQTFEGKLEEFMIFDTALTQSDVEKLYFDGQTNSAFTGTWTETVVDESEEQTWTEIDFSNHSFSIPTGDSIDVVVRSLDDTGSENDSTTLNLSEGTDTYDISSLASGHQLEVEFDMEVAQ